MTAGEGGAPRAAPGAQERRALRRAVRLLDLDRKRLIWAVLAGSAGLGSGVALSAVSAWLITRAAQMPPVLELSVATVAVRTFGIAKAVMRYLERLASHRVALSGMGALRTHIYELLAAAPADAVVGLRRGDLLARTGSDVDAVGDVVVRSLLPAMIAVVVSLVSVGIVGWLHPAVGLVLALCLVLAGVVGPVLAMRSARLAELTTIDARAEISATAMTLVDGAAEVTVSGRLPALLGALRRAEARLARARDVAARPAALAAGVDNLAMGIAVLAALLIGIPATVAGTLSGIELAVVVLTPLAAFEATGMLGPAAVQLVRSGGAAVRIMDLLDSAPPRATGSPAQAGAADGPVLLARGLAVGWPGGPVVAAGIDLEVRPGRSVAVVGPSGIGKTTLLLTLAGLLPAKAGRVEIDGDPVARGRHVGRDIILTAEDAHVFATTVLENLRVARGDVTEREAARLLQSAGLGDWLAGLPEGLVTVLGSDASTISGGERRRLLLARALASPAPLLLLDEPGEHLDPATADRLVSDLLRAGEGISAGGGTPGRTSRTARGVVLVTHRLAPLGAADEVVFLGRTSDDTEAPATVLARGAHSELLTRVPAYRWAAEQEVASDGGTHAGHHVGPGSHA